MNILLTGQYPRSEALVSASRDFDRNRLSLQDLEMQQAEDEKQLRALQWGFPFITPGLFNRQDLIRPFKDLLPGSQAESLKRFFETNSFWRVLEAPSPKIDKNLLDEWIKRYFLANGKLSKEDPLILTLPFLFLFKEYSEGLSLEQISVILEAVIEKFNEFPNALICFAEPSLGWKPLTEQEKVIGKAFLEKVKKITNHPTYLYSYFFPIDKELDYLYSLPVDGFGIDFYSNPIASVLKKFPKDKTLLAGVINTESTLIESQKNIESFIHMINEDLPQVDIYFTPSGPAELLPRSVMDKKIQNLQEILLCLQSS